MNSSALRSMLSGFFCIYSVGFSGVLSLCESMWDLLRFGFLVQFVVVFIAVARVRAIAAPLNAAYTEDEFKFFLEDANSTLLLVPGAEGNKAAEASATTLGLPIAGVHWEKESSGSGEIGLTAKAKLELAPEPEVRVSYQTTLSHSVIS